MSERSIALKRRLRAGETVIGAWLTIADPAVAEIMASAGFDFVLIDAEHAPWTTALLQMALMAFKGEAPVPIVRVPWNDPVHIKQMLDVGAEGILAPMIRTVGEARALIRACRYPPEGDRGFGPRRAAMYGRATDAYVAGANESIIIIPQIEDVRTVDALEEVIDLGVDALCIGPNDLSGSAGVLRQHEHPLVKSAIDRILSIARARDMPVCAGIALPIEQQQAAIERGARMALVAADTELLVKGTTGAIAAARALLEASA